MIHRKVNLELVKKLRKSMNISIESMSKQLGYDGYQAYYYKERGIRRMSAEDIAGIAEIFKTPIDSLFCKKSYPFGNKKEDYENAKQ